MIPDDQIRMVIGILISLPFSFMLPHISSVSFKKAYSLIFSIALQYYVYDYPVIISLLFHPLVYFTLKMVDRKRCGLIITFLTMLLVSFYFAYVMIVDYGRWQIDISVILMMSICKYSLFAFAYQDGEESVTNKHKFEHRNK